MAGAIQATGSTLTAAADAIEGLTVDASRMRANIDATRGAVFAEKAAMLLAPQMGRTKVQALVAEALKGKNLREGMERLLTPDQLQSIDRPEDYLGAAETFRQRLLKDSE